ncbi:hypothetical protein V8C40DRAFT_277516 [Trichoderma camerunense]
MRLYCPLCFDGEPHQRGDLSSVDISVEHLNSKLYTASRLHGVIVANIFMTAWAVALHNFVKSPEVCLGSLVSGRDVPVEMIEGAVGLYINLVSCKCTIPQDNSLQQLLTDVHEDVSLFNTAISFQKDDSSNRKIASAKTISLERLWSRDPTEIRKLTFLGYNIVLGVADRGDALLTEAKAIAIAFSHVIVSIIDEPKHTFQLL